MLSADADADAAADADADADADVSKCWQCTLRRGGWVLITPNGAGLAPPPAATNLDEVDVNREAVSRVLRLGVVMSTQPPLLRFGAFALSLDVIALLRPLMDGIPDRSLEQQLRKAASSVSLNLAESRGRTGKDRLRFLRIALGSAEETAGCLHVAGIWGYLTDEQCKAVFAKLDHLLAILGKLTRP